MSLRFDSADSITNQRQLPMTDACRLLHRARQAGQMNHPGCRLRPRSREVDSVRPQILGHLANVANHAEMFDNDRL